MKQSKLKHSFDEVRLTDDRKRQLLHELKSARTVRRPRQLARPALAVALIAMMLGGIYLGAQFLKSPGRSQGPGPQPASTQPEETSSLPGLSVPHDTLVRLYEDTRYPIAPEQWQRIQEILARAEFNPDINGVTMDLRENDLHLTSGEEPFYFIREFREIYYMAEERFEAWILSGDDSKLLEEELRAVMESGIPIDDPSGELSLIPRLDKHHDTLWHLLDSKKYSISEEDWQTIAAILKNARYEPDINGVTEELRDTDLHLMGDPEEYIFVRDYREVYLMSSGLFAAYTLEDESSAALKNLLSEVMTEENLKEEPPAPSDPTGDVTTIPTLDLYHFRLNHPMAEEEYRVSPEQWQVIREILLRARHEPDWNAVTDDLRETDLHLFSRSEEHLFLRDFKEIYLTGSSRFVGYSLTDADASLLEDTLRSVMTEDNLFTLPEEGFRPGDLDYLKLYDRDGLSAWELTGDEKAVLKDILEDAEYVATLTMTELIEAKAGQELLSLHSEEPEFVVAEISAEGDVFLLTDLGISMDTPRNFHYRLSAEAVQEFFQLSERVYAREPVMAP